MKRISLWIKEIPDIRRFPILEGKKEVDVIVIGGGITGIMAAWHLAQRGKRVVLLEKNHLVTGDTGLTTGFLTRVPDVSFVSLAERYGHEFVKKIFDGTRKTQEYLFQLIQKHSLDCDFSPCQSYYGAYSENDEIIKKEWGVLEKIGTEAYYQEGGAMKNTPFKIGITYPNEGKCHIRKLLFSLLERISNNFMEIFEESEVLDIEVSEKITVKTTGGVVVAPKLLITMGNPGTLCPELNALLHPKITSVAAVHFENPPFGENLYWDTFDPYFYYRKVDNGTALIGGCDIDADKTAAQKPLGIFQKFIDEYFHPAGNFEITHLWSGSIFHTEDGLPYIFEHPHYRGKVYGATGFGGNGLVFGTLAGQLLTDFVCHAENEYGEIFSLERTKVLIGAPQRKKTTAPTAKIFQKIAAMDEFKNRRVLCKTVGNRKLALFAIDGNYFAIDNTCTHAGGSLCEGSHEGKTIECPLHSAKFDVTSGSVITPPASRPVPTYPVRVSGNDIEVEIETAVTPTVDIKSASASKTPTKKTHWKELFIFSAVAVVFWLAQFAAQYYWLIPGEFGGSLVRSFALAGATLIGLALFSSALFKWFPRLAIHWRIRRYLGVSGFIFGALHAWSVYHFLFDYDIASVYYSLNPFENPIIFATIAFPILFIMAVTSTDWAVTKLTPKVWKFIHRFIYIAYWGVVFHFLLINPALLKNPPGYILIAVTFGALFGELFWFIKLASKKKFLSIGGAVGIAVIILYLGTGFFAYRDKFLPSESQELAQAVEEMKKFMETNPPDADVAKNPLKSEKTASGAILRTGEFQNINYMSSGKAVLEKRDNQYFIVFGDDFKTPDGPDLQIYLTKNTEPTKRIDIQQGVQLGKLKSIVGKQSFAVPADTNIEEFRSVSIHCKAFNVPWSYAKLES